MKPLFKKSRDKGKVIKLFMHCFHKGFFFLQVPLPPNGQLQAYGLPPGQGFPVMMPPMGHALPGQPLPGSSGRPGFPGIFPPHNAAQQQQVPIKSHQEISTRRAIHENCHCQ